MKFIITITLLLLAAAAAAQSSFLLLGTYTQNGSKGIYVYEFNSGTADTRLLSVTTASNPSFLTVTQDKRFVYAVNEDSAGMVSAYRFDTTNGTLHFLNSQPSNGRHPCYISTDWRGIYVFAGNYSSGNFSVFRTNNDGSLMPAYKTVQHTGSSVNTQRQQSAHVHAILQMPSSDLFVTDLGTDRVERYRFYWKDGLKDTVPWRSFKAAPGAGPRHITFHPQLRRAYLMEELTGTVAILKLKNNGRIKQVQRISSHPAGYNDVIGSADIHVSPDGKFLYASNRGGSNTLAIFSIHKKTGKLTWRGIQSTLGLKPRNFNFDPTGRYLLVANQESNEVVIFERNMQTGALTDTGKRIQAPSPVCVQWAGR